MEWFEYLDRRVHIETVNDNHYTGTVRDYTSNADNDDEGEYITVYPELGKWRNQPIALYPMDIKTIEIILR
ncbi:MAG: hypothetical protein L0H99_04015 [Loigolactobacillus coryniformis]|uniref:hypothetical protein n=1 Tax=Loigolactobacillus coryniformis TaxID=1610 RepID=UPI0026491DA5|nr:hypothetical protein [Loigolactobacillus coryniformis]MDN5953048.1 hypothetical protein [Loigolactobacillus coryniformis]